jgi:hypothetical protein
MADWKQITARIRRARTSKDPVGQLSSLFEKTRDAMVAFELARHLETSGQNADAAKWYSTAAERFRRADWKTKAQDAATRLGGLPPESAGEAPSHLTSPAVDSAAQPSIFIPEPGLPFTQNAAVFETLASTESSSAAETSSSATSSGSATPATEHGPRRRGRRGGRNRRKRPTGADASASTATQQSAEPPSPSSPRRGSSTQTVERSAKSEQSPALRLPEPTASDSGGIALRGRYGDPGLSSRLSLLEMQFRRLLTCAPVKLDQADSAPAGPGVFLLSDSDLTSYYYVEACQTLRIAIPNLLRGGATRRGADSIKPQLAAHLGIPEARVGKYLAEHCVVRWLQLDDDASHFAHFVMAVLRPILNE